MKTKLLLSTILLTINYISIAQIIHVPADQPTIQEGINVAINGDTVLVADSTYYENINFKGKAITVASNFILDGDTSHISNTIIDGSQPEHPDSASVVRFISGEDTTSIIQGFTITRGKGTYMPPLVNYRAGGGIFCYNSGAKILNNHIVNDSITSNICSTGAGIFAWPPSSEIYIVVRNNKISHNYLQNTSSTLGVQGAAIASDCHNIIVGNEVNNNESISDNFISMAIIFCRGSSSSKYINLSFNDIKNNNCFSSGNIPYGVFSSGLYIVGDYGTVMNNNISDNKIYTVNNCSGPGIGVYNVDSTLLIQNNIIANNEMVSGSTCTGGGINTIYSTPSIINNLIYGNTATVGGGIAVLDTTPNSTLIINNTITLNSANFGGGIYSYFDNSIILNSIIYNNDAVIGPEIYEYESSTIVNYSNITGYWPGTGNIDSIPQFVDPENGDYHIEESSPCAGAGIDSLEVNGVFYSCPSFDFENEPRPMPFTYPPDMGADEVDESTEIAKNKLPILGFHLTNYPNPFSNQTTIEFTLLDASLISLSVYDYTGQRLEIIISEKLSKGKQKINWNAAGYEDGIYFIRLETEKETQVQKAIIIK